MPSVKELTQRFDSPSSATSSLSPTNTSSTTILLPSSSSTNETSTASTSRLNAIQARLDAVENRRFSPARRSDEKVLEKSSSSSSIDTKDGNLPASSTTSALEAAASAIKRSTSPSPSIGRGSSTLSTKSLMETTLKVNNYTNASTPSSSNLGISSEGTSFVEERKNFVSVEAVADAMKPEVFDATSSTTTTMDSSSSIDNESSSHPSLESSSTTSSPFTTSSSLSPEETTTASLPPPPTSLLSSTLSSPSNKPTTFSSSRSASSPDLLRGGNPSKDSQLQEGAPPLPSILVKRPKMMLTTSRSSDSLSSSVVTPEPLGSGKARVSLNKTFAATPHPPPTTKEDHSSSPSSLAEALTSPPRTPTRMLSVITWEVPPTVEEQDEFLLYVLSFLVPFFFLKFTFEITRSVVLVPLRTSVKHAPGGVKALTWTYVKLRPKFHDLTLYIRNHLPPMEKVNTGIRSAFEKWVVAMHSTGEKAWPHMMELAKSVQSLKFQAALREAYRVAHASLPMIRLSVSWTKDGVLGLRELWKGFWRVTKNATKNLVGGVLRRGVAGLGKRLAENSDEFVERVSGIIGPIVGVQLSLFFVVGFCLWIGLIKDETLANFYVLWIFRLVGLSNGNSSNNHGSPDVVHQSNNGATTTTAGGSPAEHAATVESPEESSGVRISASMW